jgi:aminomethyltransferase
MPVQYEGIRQEHLAVRSHAGAFDVSHMGQVETRGPDALAFLQHVLSNDVSRVPIGGAQYSVLCNQDGGVLDDLFTYRTADDCYLTVTNAANHRGDYEWLLAQARLFDVEVMDRASEFAMLAIQGPAARGIVGGLTDAELPARFQTLPMAVAGQPCLVCGTGYTGEAGVEILTAPESAVALWDALLSSGAKPVGLGARDTLRLEVCYCLYGNELSEDRGPIEAGLGWCCKEATGFIGSRAVAASRDRGPRERLVGFVIRDGGIARGGNPVNEGGTVTSGTLSPSLGVGIGMAYLPTERADTGEAFEIDVRGRVRVATVVEKPIYRPPES